MNRRSIARPVNNNRVVLVHGDALRVTEVLKTGIFQIKTDFFRNHSTASEDGDILKHGFATISKTGRLTCSHFNDATHVVNDQCCERLAFDIFSDDNERTRCLGNLLKNREKLSNIGDLLVHQQYEGIFHFGRHVVLIVDEVRREVASVKLHAFNDVQFVFEA